MTVNCDTKLYAGHGGKDPRIAYPYTKWRQALNLTFQTNNPGEGNGHPQDRRFRRSQMVIASFESANVWKKAFLEN
jgi:hypothetical protein